MVLLVFSDADQAVGNLVSAVIEGQQPRESLLVANALINLGYAPVVAVRVACTQARPVRLEERARPQLETHLCLARGWRPPTNVPDSHLMNRGDECIGHETSRRTVTPEAFCFSQERGGECVSAQMRVSSRSTDTPRAAHSEAPTQG